MVTPHRAFPTPNAILAALAAASLSACGAGNSMVPVQSGFTNENGSASLTNQQTFDYTGKEQFFSVPAGVNKLTVVAIGAKGGGYKGARGGRVYAIVPGDAGAETGRLRWR